MAVPPVASPAGVDDFGALVVADDPAAAVDKPGLAWPRSRTCAE